MTNDDMDKLLKLARKINYGGGRNQGKTARAKYTEAQAAERAVLSVMHDWPLKPGQMLVLGPASVKILSTRGAYDGALPDVLVLDRSAWSVV